MLREATSLPILVYVLLLIGGLYRFTRARRRLLPGFHTCARRG